VNVAVRFAAEAVSMQIQSWEEKISQCAGDVRASTGTDGESQRVDRSTKVLQKDGLAKVEEEI
jgi:hypothetical protein